MTDANPGTANTVTVAVTGPAAVPDVVSRLVEEQVASRIAALDSTLWGTDAEEESAKRLGWVTMSMQSDRFNDVQPWYSSCMRGRRTNGSKGKSHEDGS